MKKIISILIFCFIFSYSYSQVGEWTWISGNNYKQSVGHYGIQGIPDTANYPPAVYEPCDWHDQQGNFWIFGGFHTDTTYFGDMADLWKYNPTSNEWTWMKGSAVYQDTGNYGVKGVSSPSNNPAGRGWGTPSWTDNSGNFWLYGGDGNFADLWKYSTATNEWTWMHGTPNYRGIWHPTYPHYGTFQVPSPSNTPGNRSETAASWTDANGDLWLFGGAGVDSLITTAVYNDLWKFDVSLNQWVWMYGPNYPNDSGYYGIKGVASALNRPRARMSYAKWKDASGNFYLFGGLTLGACGEEGFNDVWKYDIFLNNWVWIGGDSVSTGVGHYSVECVTLSTNVPRNAFENRSTCYDSVGNVFVFGSMGVGIPCGSPSPERNELWQYSNLNNEWTLQMRNTPVVWGTKGISSSSNAPPKTFGSDAWYRNDEIWVFGGSDGGNNNCYNCLWRYKIDRSCFPTGITENNNGDEVELYPNPFDDKLNIHIADTRQSEIILYDLLSRKLLYQEFTNSISLITNQLNKGVYIYEMRNRDGLIQKGIVVKD